MVFYERECIPLSTFLSREIFNYFYFSLNSFLFRSIVPQFPGQFHLARPPWPRQSLHANRGGTMPHYLSQVSYTPEAWARLVAHPQDRIEAVRGPIEKLGGRIHNAFFAFGNTTLWSSPKCPTTSAPRPSPLRLPPAAPSKARRPPR